MRPVSSNHLGGNDLGEQVDQLHSVGVPFLRRKMSAQFEVGDAVCGGQQQARDGMGEIPGPLGLTLPLAATSPYSFSRAV